jgi:hypothetical protein
MTDVVWSTEFLCLTSKCVPSLTVAVGAALIITGCDIPAQTAIVLEFTPPPAEVTLLSRNVFWWKYL